MARKRERGAPAWGPWLLAGGSLLVGSFFQDTTQYGWLAAAATGMLLVRLGIPFRAVEPPAVRGEGLPATQLGAWLTVGAHLIALWLITYAVIDRTRGTVSTGEEELLIASAWGLYGLILVLTAPLFSRRPSWLAVGQSVLAFAISFLLIGGLMANARWAGPLYRFGAYAGVPGAILVAAWVRHRRGELTDPDRLLAAAAVALGFGLCSFEVRRWLEPLFTYPNGSMVSPEQLARDQNLQSLWTLGLWGGYSLLLIGTAAWLRSRTVRFLGTSLLVSTLLYGLFWLVA